MFLMEIRQYSEKDPTTKLLTKHYTIFHFVNLNKLEQAWTWTWKSGVATYLTMDANFAGSYSTRRESFYPTGADCKGLVVIAYRHNFKFVLNMIY